MPFQPAQDSSKCVAAQPAAKDDRASVETLRRARDVLQIVGAAWGQIQESLAAIDKALCQAQTSRRKPPSSTAFLQRQIDQGLASIDRIFDATEYDGLKVLKGQWPDGCGASPDGGGSFLPSLRGISWEVNDKTRIAQSVAVVREAMKEVAGRRERFEAFLKDKVEPLLIELEVAGENLQAAQTAGADAAFADSAGRITAAQALANLTAISNVRRDAAPPLGPDSGAPRLTIRRD